MELFNIKAYRAVTVITSENEQVVQIFNYTHSMKNQLSLDDTHLIQNYEIVYKKSIVDGTDKVRN